MPEPKPQLQPAAELVTAAELSDDAKSKLRPDATPSGFMRELVSAGLLADAVKYLAQAIGPARAIAWALACLKELRAERFPESAPALAAFDAWASDPSDANRRAAAEVAGKGPERSLGLAIFFSGGSIAPPDVNPVPPPPHLAEKLAAGAIMLAVVGEQPENAADRYRRCIEIALKK
ncbi:MAG TPA: hypothetical protein VG345_14065 [Bryobacteraceae bacterium]|nr:hypothetical protein [Bryobacteraceae bacterium]